MRISDWSSDVCSSDLSDDYAWLQRDVLGDEASRRLPRARAFTALAAELGVGPAPLAIAWCLRNPHVSSVILGASRVAQLLQNLEALDIAVRRSEEHTSELQSLMRISYAVFCLKKKNTYTIRITAIDLTTRD